MKLELYMSLHNLTDDAFAQRIGVAHRLTVSRYRRGLRTPKPRIMERIVKETGGAVTANDFINVEDHPHD